MTASASLAAALRLSLAVQTRAKFPHVYLGVALVLALALRLLADDWRPVLLPVLLLGEPGTLGLYLVAAQRYYARNEGTDVALQVTPLAPSLEIAAPILVTAVLGTVAGVLIQSIALGIDARLALLVPPLFFTVVLSGVVGVFLADVFSEFTRFILGSIPAIVAFQLPLASLLGWLPPIALAWLPSQWSLSAFTTLTSDAVNGPLWAACCAALAATSGAGMLYVTARAEAPAGPAVEAQ
jgi:fluoroquinolone transport system permease protein